MTGTTCGIVAGYDGRRARSGAALGGQEAGPRGTLSVCLAWTPDHMELPTESALCDLARQHGKEIPDSRAALRESWARARAGSPGLAFGSAAQVLCERSRAAEMVVWAAAATASCPACGSARCPGSGPGTSGAVVVVRGACGRQPGPRSGRAGAGRLTGWPGRDRLRPSRRPRCATCRW